MDAHGFGPPEVPNQHDFDWGAEATQGEGVRDIAARILGVFLGSYNPATGDTALPAAIGAQLACPDATVIDIDGDSSFNMTLTELSTAHSYVPILS